MKLISPRWQNTIPVLKVLVLTSHKKLKSNRILVMNLKHILIPLTLLATGCTSTYKHTEAQKIEIKLDGRKGVLISTSDDGAYGSKQYHNSGRMTANAIRSAFSKESSNVDVVTYCHGENCLNNIDTGKYGYYVKPEIFHWEDRSTEWSGKPDRIEIQLITFDALTKKELAKASFTGKSKWGTFGGDHPQDLLQEPTNKYVKSLYR